MSIVYRSTRNLLRKFEQKQRFRLRWEVIKLILIEYHTRCMHFLTREGLIGECGCCITYLFVDFTYL